MSEIRRMRVYDKFYPITRVRTSPPKYDHPVLAKSAKEKLDLWRRMQQGDTKALMKLSFMSEVISAEEYDDYQTIEKEHGVG